MTTFKMGKKPSARSKKAPLASFESLMSIESLVTDDNMMNGNSWTDFHETNDDNDNYVHQSDDNNDHGLTGQPWDQPDFYKMNLRQQNCQIFKVSLASKVTHLSSLSLRVRC